jgi:T4-like virus tail tube protein gp19
MAVPTLQNFASTLREKNIARPNLYYVTIVTPNSMAGTSAELASMWCSAAHTPHTTISTNDNYIEAGVRRKYAYDVDYQNLVLNFYVDQDFEIKKFFDTWKQKVTPYNRQFNYPDSYTADKLSLYILNQENNVTYEYEYSRVFPKTISSMELSYSSGNSIAGFTVEFVFEDVYFKYSKDGSTSKPITEVIQEKQNALNNEVTANLNPKSRN